MINYPLLSYIIISYNQEKHIKDALESAFLQNYKNLEIVISDDCSTDNTFFILKQLVENYTGPHSIVLNLNKKNLGLAGNINESVNLSKGDFLIISGGDDIAYPTKSLTLVEPMLLNEKIVAVHSAVDLIDIMGNNIGMRVRTNADLKSPYRVIRESYRIVAQSQCFRRSIFDFFGPFQEFVNDEGLPFAFRESCLGEVKYIDKKLIQYRIGDGASIRFSKSVDGRTIQDQIRNTSWHFNSFRQIIFDYDKVQDRFPDLRKEIEFNLAKYKCFYEVNFTRFAFKSLFLSFSYGIGIKSLRCFIRRNSPFFIRYLYYKIF